MRLFQDSRLTVCGKVDGNLIESLWKSEVGRVPDKGPKQTVFVGNLQISARSEEVLRGVLYCCPVVRPHVRVTTDTGGRTIRLRVKAQVLPYIRIDRYGGGDAVREIGHSSGAHSI